MITYKRYAELHISTSLFSIFVSFIFALYLLKEKTLFCCYNPYKYTYYHALHFALTINYSQINKPVVYTHLLTYIDTDLHDDKSNLEGSLSVFFLITLMNLSLTY